MTTKPLNILIDADMFVFRASSSVEREINWEDDLWTLHADAAEAKAKVDDMVQLYAGKVLKHYKHEGEYNIIMCFTDKVNYRKGILPTYKMNRVGKRKPVCYQGVKQWVEENFTCYQRPTLEADDVIGILATTKDNCVVISGDKDFRCIPCMFFDFVRDEFYDITEEQADYWHLYQTLIGDTADGYAGCSGIGAVTAKKILDESPTWDAVVKTFIKKGFTEEDALVQARVARILRKSDYDLKTRKPILWTPNQLSTI